MRFQIIMVLVVLACLCAAEIDMDVQIREQLQHFSEQRFPNGRYGDSQNEVRQHIKRTFENSGLRYHVQNFNTSVNTEIISIQPKDEVVEGQNIIAVAEAISNRPEAVIVVGADYDTNGIDNPLFNNGAGMAVLLETVRLFMYNTRWSQYFKQNFTTVFVAFDINTKEHERSTGKPGSWYFVHEWLWPFLNRSAANFGGAYIIDSVMNFNKDTKSQTADDDLKQLFPTTYTHLTESDFKGDFLSMITLDQEKSLKLKDQYSGKYNRDRMKRQYHLEDMTLPKSMPMNKLLTSLTRQASFHFWTFAQNETVMQLPAVLLTDTGYLRRMPAMSGCDKNCPMSEFLTEGREEFLVSTTQALTHTLLSRQAHPISHVFRRPSDMCHSPCSASTFLTRSRNAFMSKTTEALVQTLADTVALRQNSESSGVSLAASSLFTLVMVILSMRCFTQ